MKKSEKIIFIIILVFILCLKFLPISFANTKEKQTKQNGIYKIAVGKIPSKTLEVQGGARNNNASIGIWEYGNDFAQKFRFEYQEEGYYKITAMHTGKSLTARNNKIEEGNYIVQYDYQGLEAQKWLVRDSKINGWIISPLSNPELAINIEKTIKNGEKLVLSKVQKSDNQMFYLFNISKEEQKKQDGIYKIAVGKNPSKTMEVQGSNKNNNAMIGIWQYGNVPAQKFRFEYQEEGYYKITAMHTGKSLTAKGNKIEEGNNIVQYDYQGLEAQKWLVRDSKVNGWVITPLSNPELAISIEKNIQNGAKLVLSKVKNNDNQMFYLFNISKEEQKKKDGIYKIAVGKDSGKTMEVQGSNKNNNAMIGIWQYGNVPAQKFRFEYQEEGYYKITAMHTGKSLTARNNKIEEGNYIVQYDYQGLEAQKWILRNSNINGWVITPLSNPELAITIEEKIRNGERLILSKTKDNDNQMFYLMNGIDLNLKEGMYGKSGLMYKGKEGHELKYYQMGKGNKHLFLNFAIHGFEDVYDYDGQELTYIANELFKYLKDNISEDLNNKWTIYILPSLNPDGEYNGWTKDGPGRTTLYSLAPNNKGIDMNRCFPVGYKSIQNVTRNYNGTAPLQAYEAVSLRDFILNNIGTQNIIIDVHGWLDETIGDYEIGKYYRNEFGISKHIYTYGNGYLINWARSLPNTRSMLLELPEVKSHTQLQNNDYVNKFIKGTMNLLKDM